MHAVALEPPCACAALVVALSLSVCALLGCSLMWRYTALPTVLAPRLRKRRDDQPDATVAMDKFLEAGTAHAGLSPPPRPRPCGASTCAHLPTPLASPKHTSVLLGIQLDMASASRAFVASVAD